MLPNPRHLNRLVVHEAGDLTAAFLVRVFCALADAFWGKVDRNEYRSITTEPD